MVRDSKSKRPHSAGSNTLRKQNRASKIKHGAARRRQRPASPLSHYARTSRHYNTSEKLTENSHTTQHHLHQHQHQHQHQHHDSLSSSGISHGRSVASRSVFDASLQIRGSGKLVAQASSTDGAFVKVSSSSSTSNSGTSVTHADPTSPSPSLLSDTAESATTTTPFPSSSTRSTRFVITAQLPARALVSKVRIFFQFFFSIFFFSILFISQ